jgi:hypothetical protein
MLPLPSVPVAEALHLSLDAQLEELGAQLVWVREYL